MCTFVCSSNCNYKIVQEVLPPVVDVDCRSTTSAIHGHLVVLLSCEVLGHRGCVSWTDKLLFVLLATCETQCGPFF